MSFIDFEELEKEREGFKEKLKLEKISYDAICVIRNELYDRVQELESKIQSLDWISNKWGDKENGSNK